MIDNVLFFGAGASYGSDNFHLVKQGLLPPLGKNLFATLQASPYTNAWKRIPEEIKPLFTENFEAGMAAIMDNDRKYIMTHELLIELALYFAQFRPLKYNLYYKLAEKISSNKWRGAIITLNYERLLEESLLIHKIFPLVAGADITEGGEIKYAPHYLELCYPHGACHFCIGFPREWEKEPYSPDSEILGGAIYQLVHHINVIAAYTKKPLPHVRRVPLICAYEPNKRPFSKNNLTLFQQARFEELVINAKQIIMVGVNCNLADTHIWTLLARTQAKIIYIDPNLSQINKFISWAENNNKQRNLDYQTINSDFKHSFNKICNLVDLK